MPLVDKDDGKAEHGEDRVVHGVGATLLVIVRRGEEGDAVESAQLWFSRMGLQRWASR